MTKFIRFIVYCQRCCHSQGKSTGSLILAWLLRSMPDQLWVNTERNRCGERSKMRQLARGNLLPDLSCLDRRFGTLAHPQLSKFSDAVRIS